MVPIDSFQFEEFALCQKTFDLLERYGIHPMLAEVKIYLSADKESYHWSVTKYPGTPSEQLERLQRLHINLGIEVTKGKLIVESNLDLYDILCNAIAKAPKNFTRSL